MSKCSCKLCVPKGSQPAPGECLDTTECGSLVVQDDNCASKVLEGSGLVFAKDGRAILTDGSENQGVVELHPEKVVALKSIVGLDESGNLYQLDTEGKNGYLVVVSGDRFVLMSKSAESKQFVANELRSGTGGIATFICGSENMLELGVFSGCPNGLIGFSSDVNPKPLCLSYSDLVKALVEPMCASLEPVGDTEEITASIVCTPAGLRKSVKSVSKNWLQTPALVYMQGKVYPGFVEIPGAEIINVPPIGPIESGYFVDETKLIDLTQFDGYDERATSVLINILGKAYGGASTIWDLVLCVNGMEYMRIALGRANGQGTDSSQVEVPIPSTKKITVNAYRQVASGVGEVGETGFAAVWLQAFCF